MTKKDYLCTLFIMQKHKILLTNIIDYKMDKTNNSIDIKELYDIFNQYKNITTDSRKIEAGDLFFALKGDNFDGNVFAKDALAKGAAYCIIDNPSYKINERCILVEDVLSTLQSLAAYHRQQLQIPIIAVTGTNGKTTTKELVKCVLSKKYRTYATIGNLNNHIGVPLTLLSITDNIQIAIVEMGANHPGEIDFLCKIAQPNYGLITNVGKAHLEGFGSFEGVINTKTELYRHLKAKNGMVFVNSANEILMNKSEEINRVIYGNAETADCKGAYRSSNPCLKFYFENGDIVYSVDTQILGSYNFENAMAAVAVGKYFNVDLFDVKTALEEYTPTNKRSQIKETEHNSLILDCYNANPSSMKVAIENFGEMKTTNNKVVILGAMKELGIDSDTEHKNVVEIINKYSFDKIILIGNEFSFAQNMQNENFKWFATTIEAKDFLTNYNIINSTILLKGSNSMKIDSLEEIF